MNDKLNIKHLSIANSVLDYLRNSDLDYLKLLANENRLEEYILPEYKLTDDETYLLKHTDFVSLVNFFGDETYYSRGAFLDIVVNNQMCKNVESIELNVNDYICSIIENVGFFFIHNDNGKYFERVVQSLTNLNKFEKFNTKLNKKFNKIKKYNIQRDTLICEIKELKLKTCQKYEYYQLLLKIVYHLLDQFVKPRDDVFIPFENFISLSIEANEEEFNVSPLKSSPTLSNIFKDRSRKMSVVPTTIDESLTSQYQSPFDASPLTPPSPPLPTPSQPLPSPIIVVPASSSSSLSSSIPNINIKTSSPNLSIRAPKSASPSSDSIASRSKLRPPMPIRLGSLALSSSKKNSPSPPKRRSLGSLLSNEIINE